MLRDRVLRLNRQEVRRAGDYVLYHARANRRADGNHALEFAAGLANDSGVPLLVYEELSSAQPHANDRFHTFVLEGVPETARRLEARGIGYVFHLAPPTAFIELAARAAAVVTDDYPIATALPPLETAAWAVDSSCIVPMRRIAKQEYGAYTLRPKINKLLPQYLRPVERVELRRAFHGDVAAFHTPVAAADIPALVASCEIDHTVPPAHGFPGGRLAAERALAEFLENRLHRYARERNLPGAHATSELSPYLHFGHISALEVALAVIDYAQDHKLMAADFLEELIVRRELAFNFALYGARLDSLTVLPSWARETLARHAADERSPVYTRPQLERAQTHDPLWNATQKELLRRGKIHGYYRMYWGKKIMEWSATHEEALATMIALHDRYAIDGRDPNTYTGILWCFGLHDRPWRERPVFGKTRYMSFEGMKRKTAVAVYIQEIESLP